MPTKFPEHEYLYPPVADSSRLLVGCSREDYSASRIAHAVEDCDAHLLNLNVTSFNSGYDADTYYADNSKFPVVFDIRVSHRNADSIMRSLERYGYTVLDTEDAPGADNDTVRERIDLFFKYLES
ncbi:hypothetical protein IMSAGC008_01825 [Muribaculaceae bacterium]|nr:hypothetical protein IMSAGC008_01825 [Muribaculaceae bacterium]